MVCKAALNRYIFYKECISTRFSMAALLVKSGTRPVYTLRRTTINNLRHYEVESVGSNNTTRVVVPSVTTVTRTAFHKPGLERYAARVCVESFKSQILAAGKLSNTGLLTVNSNLLDAMADNALAAPNVELEKSAAFGTSVHELIEKILQGEEVPFVPEELQVIKKSVGEWRRQAQLRSLRIVTMEEPVYSKTYNYAGTLDCVAVRTTPQGEAFCVIDWKTSNSLHIEYALQLAAYAKAYEELNPDCKIKQALIVRFSKTEPTFTVDKVKDIDAAFEGFLAALKLYNLAINGAFVM